MLCCRWPVPRGLLSGGPSMARQFMDIPRIFLERCTGRQRMKSLYFLTPDVDWKEVGTTIRDGSSCAVWSVSSEWPISSAPNGSFWESGEAITKIWPVIGSQVKSMLPTHIRPTTFHIGGGNLTQCSSATIVPPAAPTSHSGLQCPQSP